MDKSLQLQPHEQEFAAMTAGRTPTVGPASCTEHAHVYWSVPGQCRCGQYDLADRSRIIAGEVYVRVVQRETLSPYDSPPPRVTVEQFDPPPPATRRHKWWPF